MADTCRMRGCGKEIDRDLPYATITINRGGQVTRYYLCEPHANELESHFLAGKLRINR